MPSSVVAFLNSSASAITGNNIQLSILVLCIDAVSGFVSAATVEDFIRRLRTATAPYVRDLGGARSRWIDTAPGIFGGTANQTLLYCFSTKEDRFVSGGNNSCATAVPMVRSAFKRFVGRWFVGDEDPFDDVSRLNSLFELFCGALVNEPFNEFIDAARIGRFTEGTSLAHNDNGLERRPGVKLFRRKTFAPFAVFVVVFLPVR